MSLTRKLVDFQLGLIQPSSFQGGTVSDRLSSLRPSLYREVATTSDESAQNVSRTGGQRSGYLTIDIEKSENRYLLAGCYDGSVEIFDLDPVEQSRKQRCKRIAAGKGSSRGSHCNRVQWYPHDNGVFVSSGQDKTVKIWDTNRMAVVEEFRFTMPVSMHHLPCGSFASARHSLIAVASQESNVYLVDMRTGAQTQHLHGQHKTGVLTVQWSPYDSNVLMSGDKNGHVFVWDVRRGKSCLTELRRRSGQGAHRGPIVALKFTSPDESLCLASVDGDGTMRIWDALTLNLLMESSDVVLPTGDLPIGIDFAYHGGAKHRHGLVFLPSGANVHVVPLWKRSPVKKLALHLMRVMSCAYRGDDYQELYTAGADKTIGCFCPQEDDEALRMDTAARDKDVTRLTQDDWGD